MSLQLVCYVNIKDRDRRAGQEGKLTVGVKAEVTPREEI